MKIAAILGAKDEAELIDLLISHLRAIGVDHIVACDMQSSDGTGEILDDHATDDDFTVVQMDDQLAYEAWAHQIIALGRATKADWVTFLDADEFPIPATGSLKDCEALVCADAVKLNRYNVALTDSGPAIPDSLDPDRYDELLLVTDPISDYWTRIKENVDIPWIHSPIAPRTIARPQLITGLTIGAHDVLPRGSSELRRAEATDIVIAHLPFTSRARFERKVENIRRIFATHDEEFGDRYALHWRRWVMLADQGKLGEEFARMVFDDRTLSDLRTSGIIRSPAELFRERALKGNPG